MRDSGSVSSETKKKVLVALAFILLTAGLVTAEQISTITITVTTTPQIIEITRDMPETVRARETFSVNLTLNNSWELAALNITVKEEIPSGYLLPRGWHKKISPEPESVNITKEGDILIIWFFENLEPYTNVTLHYKIKAPTPPKVGNYTFKVEVTYSDEFGNEYVGTNIGIQEVRSPLWTIIASKIRSFLRIVVT